MYHKCGFAPCSILVAMAKRYTLYFQQSHNDGINSMMEILLEIVIFVLGLILTGCGANATSSNTNDTLTDATAGAAISKSDEKQCQSMVAALGPVDCSKEYSTREEATNPLMRLVNLRCKYFSPKHECPANATAFDIDCIIGLTADEIESVIGKLDYCGEPKAKNEIANYRMLDIVDGTMKQNENFLNPGVGLFLCGYQFYKEGSDPNCAKKGYGLNLLFNDGVCSNYSWVSPHHF